MNKRDKRLKALSLVGFSTALIMVSVFTGCGEGSSKKSQTEATALESERTTSKETEKYTSKTTEVNETEAAESAAAEKPEAETAVPGMAVPETAAPETDVPETAAPDAASAVQHTEQYGTAGEAYEEPEGNTDRMELSGYAYEEGLPSIVEILELEETEPQQFFTFGKRYEGGGMSVEWQPVSETNPMAAITIECSNNNSVSMNGIYCGQPYGEAKDLLMQAGWHIVGYDLEHPAEFYIAPSEQEHYMMHLTTEEAGDTITRWTWLNWPQGAFVIN